MRPPTRNTYGVVPIGPLTPTEAIRLAENQASAYLGKWEQTQQYLTECQQETAHWHRSWRDVITELTQTGTHRG